MDVESREYTKENQKMRETKCSERNYQFCHTVLKWIGRNESVYIKVVIWNIFRERRRIRFKDKMREPGSEQGVSEMCNDVQ